jgi:hypothetical protein
MENNIAGESWKTEDSKRIITKDQIRKFEWKQLPLTLCFLNPTDDPQSIPLTFDPHHPTFHSSQTSSAPSTSNPITNSVGNAT